MNTRIRDIKVPASGLYVRIYATWRVSVSVDSGLEPGLMRVAEVGSPADDNAYEVDACQLDPKHRSLIIGNPDLVIAPSARSVAFSHTFIGVHPEAAKNLSFSFFISGGHLETFGSDVGHRVFRLGVGALSLLNTSWTGAHLRWRRGAKVVQGEHGVVELDDVPSMEKLRRIDRLRLIDGAKTLEIKPGSPSFACATDVDVADLELQLPLPGA